MGADNAQKGEGKKMLICVNEKARGACGDNSRLSVRVTDQRTPAEQRRRKSLCVRPVSRVTDEAVSIYRYF